MKEPRPQYSITMREHTNAFIFGLAIVASSLFLGYSYVSKSKTSGEIRVTGLGKKDFESDLIVWEGTFSADNINLKQAYLSLEQHKKIIQEYLANKGVPSEQLVFSAVQTNQKYKAKYSQNGEYIGEDFNGFNLSQSVQIESKEVEKVEKISREITELLNLGVAFYSEPPRYYYTQLADLKVEMISKATEDARIRAERIAEHSGAGIGDLVSAHMGVFQITGQNSKEDYSWGGTFNTSAKKKTASITMKLVYRTE